MALRSAGIEKFNIVNVSSILPPGCQVIPKNKGLEELKAGQIVYCVMSRNSSNEPNRLMSASIGAAISADQNQHGYISEHHDFGKTEQASGEYAEDLAATMLASTLGLKEPESVEWEEKEEYFKISGKIVKTINITQSSIGTKGTGWVTVLAAAVFVP